MSSWTSVHQGNSSNAHLVTVWKEDAGDELAVNDLVPLVHLVGHLGPVDDGVVLEPLEVDPGLAELHGHTVGAVSVGNLLLLKCGQCIQLMFQIQNISLSSIENL